MTAAALDLLLSYAKRGWPVFPLEPDQKRPLTADGFYSATTKAHVIEQWHAAFPDANWGIPTGRISGICAIDIDVKGGRRGLEAIEELQLGRVQTLVSQTPSGGCHYIFKTPIYSLPSAVNQVRGFDVRGEGGYIAVPPSVIDDAPYQWVLDADPVPMPAELLQRLEQPRSTDVKNASWGVRQGARNDHLTRVAGGFRSQGASPAVLEAALIAANEERCDPPLDLAEVKRIARSVARYSVDTTSNAEWPEPTPLPDTLPPVAALELETLPPALRNFARDISDRLQCPPDFPAVAALVGVGSLIGRQVGIQPQQHDDWLVVPNLWGAVIGRPGVMKSPALKEALKPIFALELLARDAYTDVLGDYQHAIAETRTRRKLADQQFSARLKNNPKARLEEVEEPSPPVRRRFIVNDATVEKLGEILNDNPNGLLLVRDELTGFLRNLDKPGREAERAFYLEAWNGDSRFTYDRIGRGTIDIDSCTVSIIGGIQPGPFLNYMRSTRHDGARDDGLLQRFQLIVWPDDPGEYQTRDRAPDSDAHGRVRDLLGRCSNLATSELTKGSEGPSVSFVGAAYTRFQTWRETLENRLRADELQPSVESHLAKYRSLIPSLALINQVMIDTHLSQVGVEALEMAIAMGTYLESHAMRIYAPIMHAEIDAARLLARRLERREISAEFAPRDVYRHAWAGLSNPDVVKAAAALLEDFDWLTANRVATPGRTKLVYRVNPRIYQ